MSLIFVSNRIILLRGCYIAYSCPKFIKASLLNHTNQVHLLGLEHSAEHLWALLEAVLRQEVHEWHVDRTPDVPGVQSWAGGQRSKRRTGLERHRGGRERVLEATTSRGYEGRELLRQK